MAEVNGVQRLRWKKRVKPTEPTRGALLDRWTAHSLSNRDNGARCGLQGCSVAAEPGLLSLPVHPPTTSLIKLAAAHLDDFGIGWQRLEPAWLPRVAAPLPLLQPNRQERAQR